MNTKMNTKFIATIRKNLGNWDHVLRLTVILALVGTMGFTVRQMLVPESFGEAGHYRLNSLWEIMEQEPLFQGKESCRECHEDILDLHQKDIHFGVSCEDCHGPGKRHVKHHQEVALMALEDDEMAPVAPDDAVMPQEYTLEGCLYCHRKLNARPRDFPQIVQSEHYRFLKVTKANTPCIECHNPHEPLFLLTDVSEARIHPIIYECSDCHDAEVDPDYLEVRDHPAIFVCKDCHPAIVEDFEYQSHSYMPCTSCHLFHQENETAGRIFKNGSNRFCNLCHEQETFKDQEEVPQLLMSVHLIEMADQMGLELDELKEDPRSCLVCHIDSIHDSELIGKGIGGNNDE